MEVGVRVLEAKEKGSQSLWNLLYPVFFTTTTMTMKMVIMIMIMILFLQRFSVYHVLNRA